MRARRSSLVGGAGRSPWSQDWWSVCRLPRRLASRLPRPVVINEVYGGGGNAGCDVQACTSSSFATPPAAGLPQQLVGAVRLRPTGATSAGHAPRRRLPSAGVRAGRGRWQPAAPSARPTDSAAPGTSLASSRWRAGRRGAPGPRPTALPVHHRTHHARLRRRRLRWLTAPLPPDFCRSTGVRRRHQRHPGDHAQREHTPTRPATRRLRDRRPRPRGPAATRVHPAGPGRGAERRPSTTPGYGASGVSESADLTVTFSESVETGASAFTLDCGGTDQPLTVSGTGTSRTLDPASDLPTGLVHADRARRWRGGHRHERPAGHDGSRQDRDLLHRLRMRRSLHPRIRDPGLGATPAAITGLGHHAGHRGRRLRGTSPALRGFYMQDQTATATPRRPTRCSCSRAATPTRSSLGDVVRVTGNAGENQGQTQVSRRPARRGRAAPARSLRPRSRCPFASADFPERYEGMLVRMPQTLPSPSTSSSAASARCGCRPAAGSRSRPTSSRPAPRRRRCRRQRPQPDPLRRRPADPEPRPDPVRPGRAAAVGQQHPPRRRHGHRDCRRPDLHLGGQRGQRQRLPACVRSTRSAAACRLPAGQPAADLARRRSAATLRVAGMNLLNFFNTFVPDGCTQRARRRGHRLPRRRQPGRVRPAVAQDRCGDRGDDADVIGINEIENDGYGPTSAIAVPRRQAQRRDRSGHLRLHRRGRRAPARSTRSAPTRSRSGALQAGRGDPGRAHRGAQHHAFVNGGDTAPRNRPSLAQAFERTRPVACSSPTSTTSRARAAPATPPDAGDGQANCTRSA